MTPLGRPGDRNYNTFVNHIIVGVLHLLSVLHGYLLQDMLDRQIGRVSPDGIHLRHVAYGIKGVGECLLQGDNVLGCSSGREC